MLALGPWLIDLMTASPDVRLAARDYLDLCGARVRHRRVRLHL